MGKRDNFWSQVPEDEDGQILWPQESAERVALVRDAFGAKVIGALEAILDEKLAIADGTPPEPGQGDYQSESARRAVFAKMSEAQRAEVRRLVKSSCFGTLYWILVKLQNFPSAHIDFVAEPFASEVSFPPVGIKETELHHLYFEWIERFSDHGDQ